MSANRIGNNQLPVVSTPVSPEPLQTGASQVTSAEIKDQFGPAPDTGAVEKPAFFAKLKNAATSRDGKISASCAAVMLGFALIPGAGETALLIQITGMLYAGLGMSVFGRVAVEDAFKDEAPQTQAQSPEVGAGS